MALLYWFPEDIHKNAFLFLWKKTLPSPPVNSHVSLFNRTFSDYPTFSPIAQYFWRVDLGDSTSIVSNTNKTKLLKIPFETNPTYTKSAVHTFLKSSHTLSQKIDQCSFVPMKFRNSLIATSRLRTPQKLKVFNSCSFGCLAIRKFPTTRQSNSQREVRPPKNTNRHHLPMMDSLLNHHWKLMEKMFLKIYPFFNKLTDLL